MWAWTPKISETTRTTGNGPSPSGAARYAGIAKPATSIVISPATRPRVSVVIVCAATGPAAAAKPTPVPRGALAGGTASSSVRSMSCSSLKRAGARERHCRNDIRRARDRRSFDNRRMQPNPAAPAVESRWPDQLAAIDLGSNSFRLEIAQLNGGHYRRIDYLKETVRLGGGLDARGHLSDEASERG